ncbi:MAG: nucleobase:cation symporter-2 family protein [Sphingobium sp.]
MTEATTIVGSVDEVPPARQLVPLAFQHVLVMYAGAITVPLVIGRALNLDAHAMTLLVNADLVACGIATLIQTLGFGRMIGIRLPIMMGVTFASVSPMLALIASGNAAGRAPEMTLATIYGSVIVAGIFGFVAAPVVGRMARFFPPVVTGTVILMMGLSLMRVGIDWAAGGRPNDPGYGMPLQLLLAATTLVVVLLLMRFGRGLVRSGAVLFGAVIGTLIAMALGQTDFSEVAAAPWFALVRPFQFGWPRFELSMSLAMCLVMLTVLVESFGMFLAAGALVGREADQKALIRGLRADAAGTLIGGVFNTFPYTSYAQNIGLLSVTGVRSRFVCAGGGVILLLFGLCPKMAAVVSAVPVSVLGGAGLIMFGMIAASGVRILGSVEMTSGRLLTVAVSVAIGLIPVLSDQFFKHLPASLTPLTHSGIVLATICAVFLNLFFDGDAEATDAEPGHVIP